MPSKFRLRHLDSKTALKVVENEDSLFLQRFMHLNRREYENKAYNKYEPFLATIKKAEFLTSRDASNHVIHMEFKLPDGYSYSTGDVMCIYCPNPNYLVKRLLDRIKVTPDQVINVEPVTLGIKHPLPHIPAPASVANIFQFCVDIRAIPRKGLLTALARHCSDEHDSLALEQLAASS